MHNLETSQNRSSAQHQMHKNQNSNVGQMAKFYSKSHFAPAFYFLSSNRRAALKLLYAVCRVLDDAVDAPQYSPELVLAAWRLFFLEEKINDLKRFGHEELASKFLSIMKTYDIPSFVFLDLIDKGVSLDLKPGLRFETPMDAEAYCYGVAGTVGLACLPIFGVPLEQAKSFAVRLGIAIQWVNLIRDVGVDAQMNRIYLPLDHLEKFGCNPADIIERRPSNEFFQLMAYEVSVAEAHFRRAQELLPQEWHKALLPARAMRNIYLKLLVKIQSQGYPVLQKKVRLNFFEKGLTTLKTIRE